MEYSVITAIMVIYTEKCMECKQVKNVTNGRKNNEEEGSRENGLEEEKVEEKRKRRRRKKKKKKNERNSTRQTGTQAGGHTTPRKTDVQAGKRRRLNRQSETKKPDRHFNTINSRYSVTCMDCGSWCRTRRRIPENVTPIRWTQIIAPFQIFTQVANWWTLTARGEERGDLANKI